MKLKNVRRFISVSAMLVLGGLVSGCVATQVARLAVPEVNGMTCYPNAVCVEDVARIDEATALRNDAVAFVQNNLGPMAVAPRLLFCTTRACADKFGHPDAGALYFWGTNAMVVSDSGWVKFIVRHEMIHHWQTETFGAVNAGKNLPRWYIEGMAYELSRDPRSTIPNAAADRQRKQFRAWIAAGNNWRVPPK